MDLSDQIATSETPGERVLQVNSVAIITLKPKNDRTFVTRASRPSCLITVPQLHAALARAPIPVDSTIGSSARIE